jgi:Casein kinase II regulatory subunit
MWLRVLLGTSRMDWLLLHPSVVPWIKVSFNGFRFSAVWIRFCGLKGHEMFCEVERSYIEDGFNLYGLRACVSNFSDCLDLILDRIGPDDSDDSHLTQSACTLYGLIHSRYIITAHGLDAMYNKVSTIFLVEYPTSFMLHVNLMCLWLLVLPHVLICPQLNSVRRKGVWNMSSRTVPRPTCVACRTERRNGY